MVVVVFVVTIFVTVFMVFVAIVVMVVVIVAMILVPMIVVVSQTAFKFFAIDHYVDVSSEVVEIDVAKRADVD